MRMSMSLVLVGGVAAAAAVAAGAPQPPDEQIFTLYKWQQRIGVERAFVARDADGTTIQVAFAFTDRTSTVPLAASLRLGRDGTPVSYALWGQSSRPSEVNDRVTLAGKELTITQLGASPRKLPAPPRFFAASTYAPVIITQELVRYWTAHGKPASLPVFPAGDVAIEARGDDAVSDDDGKPRTLTRYTIAGLEWGREVVWLDEDGKLAALKAVDTEFDHFEAVGRKFQDALPRLVARAATDGMAALEPQAVRAGAERPGPVAYVHARLIDGTGASPVEDAVVVIDGDRIVAAGPHATVAIPGAARQVDLGGKTIVPGLWDMHAHFEQVEWGPIYLAAGVTTVRDCGNELDFVRGVRDAIDAGRGVGPRLLLACLVDGEGKASLGKTRLRSAGEIPKLIADFKAAGCAQVKLYQSFDPKLIAPLAAAAHRAGMTVTGHIPFGIGAVHAVEAGMDQINHLPFVLRAFLAPEVDPDKDLEPPAFLRALRAFDPAQLPPAARKRLAWFAAHHVVVDPTLALYELLYRPIADVARDEPGLAKLAAPLRPAFAGFGPRPEDVDDARLRFDRMLAFLRVLHEAGVAIVAGTDQAVPGHSLHRELELYVSAGFTAMQAIQAATIVPARAMKRDRELGTVQAGKRADLIVVDGDPLADIRALRNVALVVAAGRAYDPAKLWASVGFTP